MAHYHIYERPCDNTQFSEVPDNAFGQRLGNRLEDVFCDLHNEEKVKNLSENSMVSEEEIFERFYIKGRYRAFDPNTPMNQALDVLHDTNPKSWGSTPSQWLDEVPMEIKDKVHNISEHERDLAHMLLCSDGSQLILILGGVGCLLTGFFALLFLVIASFFIPFGRIASLVYTLFIIDVLLYWAA